jgi:hypothetical protein
MGILQRTVVKLNTHPSIRPSDRHISTAALSIFETPRRAVMRLIWHHHAAWLLCGVVKGPVLPRASMTIYRHPPVTINLSAWIAAYLAHGGTHSWTPDETGSTFEVVGGLRGKGDGGSA